MAAVVGGDGFVQSRVGSIAASYAIEDALPYAITVGPLRDDNRFGAEAAYSVDQYHQSA